MINAVLPINKGNSRKLEGSPQGATTQIEADCGLQRGIKGSEAQHISTHEYYRSLIAQGEDLQANIAQLLEEQGKARLVIAEAEQAKKTLSVSSL